MADVLDDLFGDEPTEVHPPQADGAASAQPLEPSRQSCCSLGGKCPPTVTSAASNLLGNALHELSAGLSSTGGNAKTSPAVQASARRLVSAGQQQAAASDSDYSAADAEQAWISMLLAAAKQLLDDVKATLVARRSWPDDVTRKAFVAAHLACVTAYLGLEHPNNASEIALAAADVIRHADMAYVASGDAALQPIVAAAIEHLPQWFESRCLTLNADAEEENLAPSSSFSLASPPVRGPDRSNDPAYLGPIDVYTRTIDDVDSFRTEVYEPARPVVLPPSSGLTRGWTALQDWTDLAALVRAHGMRTVPVEVGRHSLGTWREDTMLFSEFARRFLVPSALRAVRAAPSVSRFQDAMAIPSDEVGYIAQHPLFDHIPALKRAFRPPVMLCKHCNGGGGIRRVNAWIGTHGTVTPLHFDSYDNLLVQVIGYKLVRLYDPQQTRYLHVDSGEKGCGDATLSQGNISPVSVESYTDDVAQQAAFPEFAAARYTEAVLGPGDALFMPRGVWHYVRSLSPSMSVNFWF